MEYTFAQTADLSIPGNYTVSAYTNLDGDANTDNDIIETERL